jgi:histone H3/H4
MVDSELGLAAIYRIIKKMGAERIGDDAIVELRTVLERTGSDIAKQAISLAQHANRRTVRAIDIKLATKIILKEQ